MQEITSMWVIYWHIEPEKYCNVICVSTKAVFVLRCASGDKSKGNLSLSLGHCFHHNPYQSSGDLKKQDGPKKSHQTNCLMSYLLL